MCGCCCAVGHIVGSDFFGTCSNVEAADCSIEESESSNWLVVWDFVSRFVDSSEREVAVLSCLTVLNTVDLHWGVASFAELGCTWMISSETDCLSAEPVADIVGVTVDKRHSHRAVQDHLEVFDEIWIYKVASLLEGVVYLVIRKQSAVIQVNADCVLNLRNIQVIGKI
jgi:hypothetical protein